MLRKAGHIFVILMLLLGTTGVTITRHYCAGRLVGTSLFSTPKHCCGGDCPMCHNEKINLRITDNFQSAQSQVNFSAGFKTLLEHHSLPTLLAYSGTSNLLLLNGQGDRCIKPSSAKPFRAGPSSPLLQVFLF
jgi:hypothetical protein